MRHPRHWLLAATIVLGVVLLFASRAVAPRSGEAATVTNASQRPVDFYKHPPTKTNGRNILIVSIDACRADHLGVYGYHRQTSPNIDSLASHGRVFERAYSPAANTAPSVVGMLTGLYPHNHGVRLLCQKIDSSMITIADHLRRGGYQTAAVVSNAVLADSAIGLGARFDHYDDKVDQPEPKRPEMFERRAAHTTDAALTWLSKQRTPDKPHLLWVHYIDPHGPYTPPEELADRFTHGTPVNIDPARVPPYIYEDGINDGLEYIDRYDEEITYADREVGRLLEGYKAAGLLDNTLVVITADHGEYMMEHEHWFNHGFYTYEPVIHVPLIIAGADIQPGREKTPVSLIDVAPTVLEAVGLRSPELDGQSLLGSIRERPIHAEGRGDAYELWRTLILGDEKLIVCHGRSNAIKFAWRFDLGAEAGEYSPVPADADSALYRRMAQIIEADPDSGGVPDAYADGELPSPAVAGGLDDETLRKMRSLGYVGG